MPEFTEYLDAAAADMLQEEERLRAADRRDEANFSRIKLNICNIAKTIYEVFSRTKGDDAAREYAAKLAGMRSRWEAEKALAEKYDDVSAVVIQGVKIDMMREIEMQFARCTGSQL